MPPSVETIACPHCGKGMRVPSDRGLLKVHCAACRADFEWSLPMAAFEVVGPGASHGASTNAAPRPPAGPVVLPTRRRDGGLAWLLLGLGLPVAWAMFQTLYTARLPGWVEFLSIFCLVLVGPVWTVRGVGRWTGWHWAVAALPALALYSAVLFAMAGWESSHDEGLVGPGHFEGLDPDTTTSRELDREMEDW